MEDTLVMDEKAKRRMGIICFIPLIAFGISFIYYMVLLFPLTQGHPQPKSAVEITVNNYSTMFILLATSSVISLCVLLYCLVHLVRIKTLNTATKMQWVLLLVCAEPFSFIFFWLFQVRKEQKNMPVYPNIG